MQRVSMLIAVSLLVACDSSNGSGDGTPDAGTVQTGDFFIARQIDFKNFRQWQSYKVYTATDGGVEIADGGTELADDGEADAGVDVADAGVDSDGGVTDPNALGPHPAGDRYAYINKLPPPGSTVFPTGTIIVKITIDPDGQENKHIHAMVKRNGGFNSKGAVGWEWMELVPAADGSPVILWRDSSPPNGSGYFDPDTLGPQGDCNVCHAASRDNDFVQSKPLQLKDR